MEEIIKENEKYFRIHKEETKEEIDIEKEIERIDINIETLEKKKADLLKLD